MHIKIRAQQPLELVTLEEAKAQCRLMPSFTLDDDRLTSLIVTATNLAQTYINKLLSVGQVAQVNPDYRPTFYLFGGDVAEVTEAHCIMPNGVKYAMGPEDFSFNDITQGVTISRNFAQCSQFTFEYSCGYVEVPQQVKQGILLLISTMYNATEDYLIGLTHENLPYTSLALFNSVRNHHA